MKRAQVEIFGLVLIVLFIAIGFLLFIRFTINSDDGAGLRETFEGSQLGQSFVNSILKADIDCGGAAGGRTATIRDIIIAVASGDTDTCDGAAGDTALNLNQTITDILDGTLDELMVNYRFRLLRPTGSDEVFLDDNLKAFTNEAYGDERCGDGMSRDANQVSIPLANIQGTVYVRLERCS